MRPSLPLTLALCLLAAAGGFWLARSQGDSTPSAEGIHDHADHAGHAPLADHIAQDGASQDRVYQCPMHPWIKSDQPGDRCTICGMALVAAAGLASAADPDPNLVTLTPAQAAVVGVKTAAARHAPLTRTLRLSGVVDDDDTQHRILAARVPGRVERLEVNYVGAEVAAGAPLATIYSPEMLTAQRQYLERLQAGAIASSKSERAAARERLLELGLNDEEVRILEATQRPTAMVNVRAPMAGTVVSRAVYEGQYVAVNDRLFEIGDFSRMWLMLDAYEPDLAWLSPGQTVEVTAPSLPGQVLTAPIAFIDPNLDAMTRTARVRVILENPGRRLLHRQTAQAVVIGESPPTLLIPRSAVLQHRGRPIVYVDEGSGYRAKEVRLGRFGDADVEVIDGLKAGEQVVVESALILDAQAELAHAATGAGGHDHGRGPTRVAAGPVPHDAAAYDLLKDLVYAAADAAASLANDDLDGYRKVLPRLRAAEAAYLAGHPPAARPLAGLTGTLVDGPDLDAVRRPFEPLSTAVADLARAEHLHHREGVHIYQCPMTPVLGTARWLSRENQLRNPFFGSLMLECGDEVE